ncbi:MAG: M48 family metallopeptidase, partial [Myxococcales bacterium]|nr:M48 family metallopeptidase [Myxococcales bacterium]
MTNPTAERVSLPGLSSTAFVHPADQAALSALRKVPALDLILRKLIGFIGERSVRLVYLASAVKVGEHQFPRLNTIYQECLETLGVEERPELYVSQTPFVNAGAVGVDEPFIVLNSGTLSLMSEEQIRFILGHELGHIICDHVLYKTMLGILVNLSAFRLGIPLTGLALFAVVAALSEWDRKSELTCDRSGLLCVQNPEVAYESFMKMAGGGKVDDMSLATFVAQAEEYESYGDHLDGVFKLLNLVGRRHPFFVLRLAELKRWAEGGDYEKILTGDYARRGDAEPTVYQSIAQSAESYKASASESRDPLIGFLRDLGTSVGEKGSSLWGSVRGRFSRKDGEEPGEG